MYAPLHGLALPSHSSPDLPHSAIGEPVLAATLQPGDVLYLPRGFVHEAQAADGEASAHITVSTYQRWHWYHLLQRTLSFCDKACILQSATVSVVDGGISHLRARAAATKTRCMQV